MDNTEILGGLTVGPAPTTAALGDATAGVEVAATGDSGAAVSGGGLVGGGGIAPASSSPGGDGGVGGGGGFAVVSKSNSLPDLKKYNIELGSIEKLDQDPKKEKIKKLAKNCSQGNKELCGWIMHKFGKIKGANPKGYRITLGYELNATTKAKKSNKPIFGLIFRQNDSEKDEKEKKLKEIPVPKSCGDCVVPTVWRNNGDEKCIKDPKNLKPIHFCVKPCKEYLFQIFILSSNLINNNQQIIFNGYENAQNYELLNRIGQIMKPKLFWAKELNNERNQGFKVNELSLNLSKININFPVFSDFLDLNKNSQEKVRNLLMTPEIIEFYVENPGLVTREVKQLLIALSDCYDVAKRYTGIFCQIKLDDGKISGYGGGGDSSVTIDNVCKKLLKEKKIGRFNEELDVDNSCGGGGGGHKREPVKNYAEEIVRLKENAEYTLSELIEFIILLNQTNDETGTNNAKISELEKNIETFLSKDKSLQKIKTSSSSSSGSSGSTEQPPLMFLENCKNPYTCWIDSLLYFLYGFTSDKLIKYYINNKISNNFLIASEYIKFGKDLKDQCILKVNNWNENFLRSLLFQTNEYNPNGMNDPVQVLENILETIRGTSTTEAINRKKPDSISQLIKPKDEINNKIQITEDNFYSTFYEGTTISDLMNNFLFQSCAARRSRVTSKYRSLLVPKIKIPFFNLGNPEAAQVNFNLKSFIVYKGGSHYVCYFIYNDQWWYYNDLIVDSSFRKKDSLEAISQEIENSTDYIILYNYERIAQT